MARFSKRHYDEMARSLQNVNVMETRENIANFLCATFLHDNDRFDPVRFYRAAGLTDEILAETKADRAISPLSASVVRAAKKLGLNVENIPGRPSLPKHYFTTDFSGRPKADPDGA